MTLPAFAAAREGGGGRQHPVGKSHATLSLKHYRLEAEAEALAGLVTADSLATTAEETAGPKADADKVPDLPELRKRIH
jgi:hypothetical protein